MGCGACRVRMRGGGHEGWKFVGGMAIYNSQEIRRCAIEWHLTVAGVHFVTLYDSGIDNKDERYSMRGGTRGTRHKRNEASKARI